MYNKEPCPKLGQEILLAAKADTRYGRDWLIVRYATNEKGKTKKIAEIYTKEEHRIERHDIDYQALFIQKTT